MNVINNVNDLPILSAAENTYLHPSITAKDELKNWVLTQLGAPLITIELTDAQLDVCIGDALQLYSKYAYFPERYIVVNLKDYQYDSTDPRNEGLCLSQWNVAVVNDVAAGYERMMGVGANDMFFGWPAFFNGTTGLGGFGGLGGSTFASNNGNWVGGFTTFHNVHEFLDLAHRLTGANPDWIYNRKKQLLQLIPPPRDVTRNRWIVLTVECEPDLDELYGEEYVRRITLAKAKILLGTIRSKFQGVNLVGGGTIDTSIKDEGNQELQTILENIRNDEGKGNFFVIS